MTAGDILVLALGLAMDATAVAAARGLVAPSVRLRDALLVGLFFGGFQAGMPLLGWLLGAGLDTYIQAVDHWIACAILAALGARMIWNARRPGVDEDASAGAASGALFTARALLPLAIATSIDALAAGVTLPLMGAPLASSIAMIGLVTALLAALATLAGRRLGASMGSHLELVGGLVLIAIGVRIPIEHLATGV